MIFKPALVPSMHSPDAHLIRTHYTKLFHIIILPLKSLFEYVHECWSALIDGPVRDMYGICMGWGMYGICMGYVRDMYGICTGFVWDMYGICMGFVWDMYGICLGYVWDMYGIRTGYV